MLWREYPLSSWREFDDHVLTPKLSLTNLKHTYCYRGQTRDWPLIPSLARLCRELSLDILAAQEVENLLLGRFKSRLNVYRAPPAREADAIWWWTLMQHYRAPTRILDWSFSPVIALYFAVVTDWDADGVIWMFHRRRVMESLFPSGINSVAVDFGFAKPDFISKVHVDPRFCVFDRLELTERMIAQRSTFTVSQDLYADHADSLARVSPEVDEKEQFIHRRKWVVQRKCKPEILKRLHAMNVTAETLFPGIDGLGDELKEFVRLSST